MSAIPKFLLGIELNSHLMVLSKNISYDREQLTRWLNRTYRGTVRLSNDD
jgi:hypothetical protein